MNKLNHVKADLQEALEHIDMEMRSRERGAERLVRGPDYEFDKWDCEAYKKARQILCDTFDLTPSERVRELEHDEY